MDLFDAIANRYSYRGEFTDAPVPRKDLEKIVQAGIQAPSACNEQVVTFVIVDDPQLLRQIAEIVDKPVCRTAKAMIAVRGRSAAGVRRHCRLRSKTARRRSRTCCWPSPPWAMPACGSTARCGPKIGPRASAGFSAFRRTNGPHSPAHRRARRAGPAEGKAPLLGSRLVQSLRWRALIVGVDKPDDGALWSSVPKKDREPHRFTISQESRETFP